MEAIDSDDYSVGGAAPRGRQERTDGENKDPNGEIKSKFLNTRWLILGIDYSKQIEESVDKLRMPINDGKIQLEGCKVLETLSSSCKCFVHFNEGVAESIHFFCDLDVIPVLIRTMRARNRDSRFQASATNILRNISGDGRPEVSW